MQVLIWRCGGAATQRLSIIPEDILKEVNIEVLGYLDTNPEKYKNNVFRGIRVYSPIELEDLTLDKIVICSSYYEKTKQELILEYNVDESKIDDWNNVFLKSIMTYKYRDSQDPEIIETLDWWKRNNLSVFNQFIQVEDTYSEVFWDEQESMPYIILEGKRMYYPSNYKFVEMDEKPVVKNILREQSPSSPHLYLKGQHTIQEGDVIVDAGVCEGNFVLRHIDKVSKAYLIECDTNWIEALKVTFKDYKDKIVICNKMLSKANSVETITLDTLVKEKVDFIKMDIEGAEIDALLGAMETLKNSNARCSICCYHRSGDEKYIRCILESYGYITSVSDGYMVFMNEKQTHYNFDFRRGIVYAKK